jgi:hypothetical protein
LLLGSAVLLFCLYCLLLLVGGEPKSVDVLWSSLFALGLISISTIVGKRSDFLSNKLLRKYHVLCLVTVLVIFFGTNIIGFLLGVSSAW